MASGYDRLPDREPSRPAVEHEARGVAVALRAVARSARPPDCRREALDGLGGVLSEPRDRYDVLDVARALGDLGAAEIAGPGVEVEEIDVRRCGLPLAASAKRSGLPRPLALRAPLAPDRGDPLASSRGADRLDGPARGVVRAARRAVALDGPDRATLPGVTVRATAWLAAGHRRVNRARLGFARLGFARLAPSLLSARLPAVADGTPVRLEDLPAVETRHNGGDGGIMPRTHGDFRAISAHDRPVSGERPGNLSAAVRVIVGRPSNATGAPPVFEA